MPPNAEPHRQAPRRSRRRTAAFILAAVSLLAEVAALRRRGYRIIGGRVNVRCTSGHEFTTLWIPGVSVRALRLAGWRLQRCPVGHHWAIVSPVRREDDGDEEGDVADSPT